MRPGPSASAQSVVTVSTASLETFAGMLESADPREAIDAFNNVIQMEKDKGEWCAWAAGRCFPAVCALTLPL